MFLASKIIVLIVKPHAIDNPTMVPRTITVLLWLQIAHAWQFPSRRQVMRLGSYLVATPSVAYGLDVNSIVKVNVQGPEDTLGIQISNDNGQVIIQRVISRENPGLKPGMRLQGFSSAQELMMRLSTGPYPVTLEFVSNGHWSTNTNDVSTSEAPPSLPPILYTKSVLQEAPGPCVIQTRKGDLLEIQYEAKDLSAEGSKATLYDASDFRGTGQAYQMVLGSGDMIPGVDQGLTGMCPGETRRLNIPTQLAYGPRARDNFKIPFDYRGLEWTVTLVSIDGVIRGDNNNLTRQQREANYSE